MTRLRRWVHRQRRFFLGVSVAALVVAVLLTAVMVAVRWSDDLGDFWVIAGCVVGGSFVLAVLCARLGRPFHVPAILELDLASLPPELAEPGLAALLSGSKQLSTREIVETLERATTDRRVKGVLVHCTFLAGGLGTIQELRDALIAFRAGGKFAVAFADSLGVGGGGTGAYYLATACDEIIVQPGGQVGFVGLASETNFLRRALDKAKVEVEADGRHEYKNAANQLLETGFTPPHRESMQRLLDSAFAGIVEGVAATRKLEPAVVRELADSGPLRAREALDAGLVDRLGYLDEAIARVKELAGRGGELLWLAKYKKRARRRPRPGAPTIAVLTGSGMIEARSTTPFNPLSPSGTISADRFAAAIRKAVADKRVKALLLRLDSPGGSAVASETIWRETVRAKEAGKPVVVSMGNLAASGGYYISAAADRIVAHPGTITGSIGVLSIKPVVGGLKDRLGVDVGELVTSRNAAVMSVNRRSSESEWERTQAALDEIYDDFTGKVASGRGLPRDAMDGVARGRVWTGADARERGLVDELGGFPAAVRAVREVAGLKPDSPVRLKVFPKTSPLSRLRGGGSGTSSDDPKALLRELLGAVRHLGLLDLFANRGSLHAGFEADDFRW